MSLHVLVCAHVCALAETSYLAKTSMCPPNQQDSMHIVAHVHECMHACTHERM